MKISADTIAVLKSFASINNGIIFKEGKKLETVSPQKTIIAKVDVQDDFDREFAIYDLGQFLNVLSLMDEPELTFNDSYVTVSSKEERVNYRYGDSKLIIAPPKKEIEFPKVDVEVTITSAVLAKIQKAGSVLGVPEVAIVGENGKITARALSTKETDGNNYQFDVGETDLNFKVIFKTENLKVLADDYTVSIGKKGELALSRWVSDRAYYLIAVEANSVIS
ncbi:sliding clamp DNA polymerase accessory protein [Caulobacter phage Cr30]|uniref:DNA polymerase processivity factor n=1 Tax=Caulobacter phage Cr30 TaxID=1357714 RepID=UPI0004A9B5C2|nr:DNA polymerase processivity factor [Caulobacter phage Cr30]AGS81023.1 sliding clamp DNA polymerase accessory protein [Caulobacter phage Cr30]